MASITEKKNSKGQVYFRIRVFLKEEEGKQFVKSKTWYPPSGMKITQARREAKIVSAKWEEECRTFNKSEQLLTSFNQLETSSKEERTTSKAITFDAFVNEVWRPFFLYDGSHRPTTISMYEYVLKVMAPKFEGVSLKNISSIDIMSYLKWLRNDFKDFRGNPYSEKSIKNHYSVFGLVFGFAERQGIITENPMLKVEAPKVRRKEVEALSKDEAQRFLTALNELPLDFHCYFFLLITSGLRRGEGLGLQWWDVDFQNKLLYVRRAVTYLKGSGMRIGEPKTETSIRTIPLTDRAIKLLDLLYKQRMYQYPEMDLSKTFIFCREDSLFIPRNPDTMTWKLHKFMARNELPNYSPHDLRHTCASLLLAEGADIKSVQKILGHANSSTTLNYYVKTDMTQMRNAVNRYGEAFGI